MPRHRGGTNGGAATAEIEDNINQARTAFVTAGILVLRGGVPIHVNGAVVGAVGVAGLSKEIDAEIANTAATALSPSPMTAQRRLRSYCSCAPVGAEDDAIASSGVWPPNEVRRSHQSQQAGARS
ncbi:heme-binding protein [Bradyrhizobium sp. BRP22]|uniref:heme-binding protein n=1 Tax=Bradyrhizobium sp. BRP22 TaxID=2793821 RepID=UPI001CD30162|nr:heme-binding protein [Bradyrhizobium sp. BRP22]MCA1452075.1 heme-binding protein [Bradyrhizobium sp. BRP22]